MVCNPTSLRQDPGQRCRGFVQFAIPNGSLPGLMPVEPGFWNDTETLYGASSSPGVTPGGISDDSPTWQAVIILSVFWPVLQTFGASSVGFGIPPSLPGRRGCGGSA